MIVTVMQSWSDRPIKMASLAFVDLETSGLRPDRGARITEIALLDADAVLHAWASDTPFPSDTAIERQCRVVFDRLGDAVVVGHNLAFDFGFLAYEAERLGVEGPDTRIIDTLDLTRRLVDPADAGLDALRDQFDIGSHETAHTALGDARTARTLFWMLVDRGELDTLADAGIKRLRWSTF